LSATKKTQRNNILAKLIAAKGKEVPLPEIASCAAQYQSRLFELRRMGYRIPAPRMETVNGQRRTWYRLECGPHSVRPVVPSVSIEPTGNSVANAVSAMTKAEQEKAPNLFDMGPFTKLEYPD